MQLRRRHTTQHRSLRHTTNGVDPIVQARLARDPLNSSACKQWLLQTSVTGQAHVDERYYTSKGQVVLASANSIASGTKTHGRVKRGSDETRGLVDWLKVEVRHDI